MRESLFGGALVVLIADGGVWRGKAIGVLIWGGK
jgi:hypothetical protein